MAVRGAVVAEGRTGVRGLQGVMRRGKTQGVCMGDAQNKAG